MPSFSTSVSLKADVLLSIADVQEQTRVVKEHTKTVQEHSLWQKEHYLNKKQRACHRVFKTTDYESHKSINPDKVTGTCRWVLEHPQFCQWKDSSCDDLLWISADPGCGKSVLSKSLVDHDFQDNHDRTVCYFFFKDNETQDSLATALCGLIHQLFTSQPRLIHHAVPAWEESGDMLQREVAELWHILLSAATDKDARSVICVLDALDECREQDRHRLITMISRFYIHRSSTASKQRWLKFLVTSRPYEDIRSQFHDEISLFPLIRLKGEDENDKIHQEINLVIKEHVNTLAKTFMLSTGAQARLERELLSMQHRTYLWLYLAIERIKETFRNSPRPDEEKIQSLPATVEDAYEQILQKGATENRNNVIKILRIIVGVRRPLTIGEMAVAFGVATLPDLESKVKLGIGRKWLEQQLPQWCGLFVFINHSRIYLIHQTAKEFLMTSTTSIVARNQGWKHCLSSVDVEGDMALYCVAYLTRIEIGKLQQPIIERDEIRNKTSDELPEGRNDLDDIRAFGEYAAEHWPAHVRSIQGKQVHLPKDMICELYNTSSERFQYWFRVFWKASGSYSDQPNMTDVRLAAFNGHSEFLRDILRSTNLNLDSMDEQGRTALFWASELGYDSVVQILLEEGADVQITEGVVKAAAGNYWSGKEIMTLLLDRRGADVQITEGVVKAAAGNRTSGKEIMTLLLDRRGADIQITEGVVGRIAKSFDQEVMTLLLDRRGADVQITEGVVQAAAENYESGKEIMTLLLDRRGADIQITEEVVGRIAKSFRR
ncbi:MAG: hypothetical protein L6R40_008585 [Gallowayella cf. fulva]|nr:MAG: hypothetical protein L6R40_008585 [Xanthomendoza cf. fulva]